LDDTDTARPLYTPSVWNLVQHTDTLQINIETLLLTSNLGNFHPKFILPKLSSSSMTRFKTKQLLETTKVFNTAVVKWFETNSKLDKNAFAKLAKSTDLVE
jgi:hypothetical protein